VADASDLSDFLGSRGAEREMLGGFLDWYHAVVVNKLAGLTDDQAAAVATPSGLSPLGIVKHLTVVERDWFRFQFAGEDIDLPNVGDDNAPTFDVSPADTVADVVAEYQTENERAGRIVADAPSLDALSARDTGMRGHVSLRWVLVHMIEETARHGGHLDILREAIDGRTGD
jgi:hypothetical protein